MKECPIEPARPVSKAILASVVRSCVVADPALTDGVCAYALAFSTLLSSQGADAHRHEALAWFRGNPANLPAGSGPVNFFRLL